MTERVISLPSAKGSRRYPIYLDPELGAERRIAEEVERRFGGARIGIVTDETVAKLHLARVAEALTARGLPVASVVVADGEGSKSLETAGRVLDALAAAGIDRDGLLLALGGGVVGDLGGFVASIYLRGIAYAQLPTTLLAQVDSSVGGKTAVNMAAGKNLCGTFYQPSFVYADLTTLGTLPARDLSAGLAELTKHAVIADELLLEQIEREAERLRAGDPVLLAEVIDRSVAIKAAVVSADEEERDTVDPLGGRARLNFGHTVGHAIESASHDRGAPLRHGESVALGMLAAARVGARLGLGDATLEERLARLWPRLGLPSELDRVLDELFSGQGEALARWLEVDKKRRGEVVRFVLVDRVGSTRLHRLPIGRVVELVRTHV